MAENLKTETAWKRRLPWIAAIVLGTLSILAVNKYLTLQQRGSEQKKVFLLAASADIKPDQELTRNDLEIRSFPAESVSEVSITVPGTGSAAASEETERKILMLVGRKTTRQIGAGQQIFWSDLASPERPTFQSRIPAHMRAVTIPVTPISSVNNLIQPGDMVDILFTSSNEDGEDVDAALLLVAAANRNGANAAETVTAPAAVPKKPARTEILLSRIPVLAVGQNFRPDISGESGMAAYSGVTLMVTPQEGVLLTHALTVGQLSLMLRPAADPSVSEAAGVEIGNMIPMSRELRAKRAAEVKHE
ncbi:MAG: Flp pilus assembly protein CpaB [Victivallales bacterium]